MSRDYISDPAEDAAFSLRAISDTLDAILEAMKITPAAPDARLREAAQAVVSVGPTPDALMDGTPSGQALRDWWLRHAATLAILRAALGEEPTPLPPVNESLMGDIQKGRTRG